MQRGLKVLLLPLFAVVLGCSGPDDEAGLIAVEGNIKLDGGALSDATVNYVPQGNTGGHGGTGKTDATGHYQITTPHGKKGLLPGEYKVTVSRRLNPDGSPPAPNEMPIESQARETLPLKYSDKERTELNAKFVAGEKRSFDFDLTVKK